MFNQTRLIQAINETFEKEVTMFSAYEKICGLFTLENLFTTDSVYCCAMRCASGFRNKKDTIKFLSSVWLNSRILCRKVLSGKFMPAYYSSREIKERGKKRVIRPPTFECKVVQKVICDYVIRPLLEPKMINTNYASVKGRGTDKMYKDIENALNRRIRDGTEFSVITADFKSYFASIRIDILITELKRFIKDERLIDLIKAFSPDEYGLSLGNELSQIPASYFPSSIDHYMKERLRIPYFRYMDDSLAIIEKGKEDLYTDRFRELSAELELVCPDEKINIYPAEKNFIFCKERFVWNSKKERYDRLINPKRVTTERKKLKTFKKKKSTGKMSNEAITLQAESVIGSISRHPHTYMAVKELEWLLIEAINEPLTENKEKPEEENQKEDKEEED